MLDALPPTRLDAANPPGHRGCGCYPWGVIQTHPQAESWATSQLNRQGYTTYLPLYPAKRRDPVTRTMTRIIQAPLFPSYAFVQIATDDPWYPIRRTPGVRQLLLAEFGKPYILHAGALEAVRATEAKRATMTPETARWAPGMACSLATGALRDTPAVVLAVEDDTAYVSMMLFGHLREVSVRLDCLRMRDAD
jgi:transcription antitermination factor NusG